MYKLYWIFKPEHADPYTEGYIGITKRKVEHRLNEHIARRDDLDLTDANIRILHVGTREEISLLEKKYRPKSWIGWNKSKGGLTGGRPNGIHTSGWTHTEESKIKRSVNTIGENNPMYGKSYKHTEIAKEKISKAHLGMKKPWAKAPVMNGKDNPRSQKVYAEGKLYDTVSACAKAHGFKNHNSVAYRCNSPKWTEWSYK